MHNRGINAVSLSGALKQEERFKALQSLKNGTCRICIATDVASRGIDIIDLDIVMHANLPRNSETLIHRSGRTGRAGKSGLSIILFSPNNIRSYNRIVDQSKISPKLKKNISRKQIEENENIQMFNEISVKSKSDVDNKLLDNLINNYSSKDLAKALISLYKYNFLPIEEIEDIDLDTKTSFKKEKFKSFKKKTNRKKINRKDKKKRR